MPVPPALQSRSLSLVLPAAEAPSPCARASLVMGMRSELGGGAQRHLVTAEGCVKETQPPHSGDGAWEGGKHLILHKSIISGQRGLRPSLGA